MYLLFCSVVVSILGLQREQHCDFYICTLSSAYEDTIWGGGAGCSMGGPRKNMSKCVVSFP